MLSIVTPPCRSESFPLTDGEGPLKLLGPTPTHRDRLRLPRSRTPGQPNLIRPSKQSRPRDPNRSRPPDFHHGARSGASSAPVSHLMVSKAGDEVIVHHPRRLHVRVTDRRADEREAAAHEVLAERVRFRAPWRDLSDACPGVSLRLAADEA